MAPDGRDEVFNDREIAIMGTLVMCESPHPLCTPGNYPLPAESVQYSPLGPASVPKTKPDGPKATRR